MAHLKAVIRPPRAISNAGRESWHLYMCKGMGGVQNTVNYLYTIAYVGYKLGIKLYSAERYKKLLNIPHDFSMIY